MAIVKEEFELDPFSSCLFVFCNRSCNKLKTFIWEHNRFWLHYRKLEKEAFYWSTKHLSVLLTITKQQLRWLLDRFAFQQNEGIKLYVLRTYKKIHGIIQKELSQRLFLAEQYIAENNLKLVAKHFEMFK